MIQKFILFAKAFLSRPGGRYLLVGGGVYALELVIILVAQHLGIGPVAAVAISFIIGTTVSFGLQKLFTFGDKRMHHRVVLSQAIAVVLLVLFNFGFTVLTTKLLQDVLPAIVVRTLALLITTIWNFFLYKTQIFKKPDVQLVT
jgi:putative flippase GtrA